MKFYISLITLFLFCATALSQSLSGTDIKKLQSYVQSLPDEMVSPDEVAIIETEYGNIIIEFFSYAAPLHAMNFKKLANTGYFNGTTFHRIIPNFVIQGGDILSRDDNQYNDGTGGPGYTIPAELGKKHLRGTVASARMPDNVNPQKRSNGSQFYICLIDLPFLDKAGYTVFGEVIRGMKTVDKIAKVRCNKKDRPYKDVIMKRVYVTDRKKLNLNGRK